MYFDQISHCCLTFLGDVSLKDNKTQTQPPRYFIQSDFSISSPLMSIQVVVHFCRCCLDPNIINSDLLLFILSLFSSIHVLMFLVHSLSSLILVVSLFLDFAGKLFLYPWSSTKACRSVPLGITSCRVET